VDRLIEATSRAEQRHFWFQGLRRFAAPLLSEAVAGVSHPRLLDAGCGTGNNLRLLSEFGQSFGFDLNHNGVTLARRAGQRRVARASVIAIPFPDAEFDVVTSFDVLYALHDEDEALAVREMARVLRPGGALIVNVAALDILRGSHSVLAEEVRRYDRRRLSRLLERAGLRVVRLTYTFATLFPLMLAVRTSQRTMGLASKEGAGREISVPAAPVNAMLAGLLRAEAAALRHVDMPFGSSLLCLARKPRALTVP
jgi:SAM-dependent methyltransferase